MTWLRKGNDMTLNNGEELNQSTFPKDVTEQAAVAAKIKPSSYLLRRLDLRGKTVLSFGNSVNGYSECALSLYKTSFGWQLGVHVTDVAEYVCEGSPLDTEARRRRASFHNGFANINMLPESISHEICNLSPRTDKLALSVLLDIAPNGNLISVKFEESVIRVAERCIYEEIDQFGIAKEASSVLALREKYSPYMNILIDMYELAAIFCQHRVEKGGLNCAVFRRSYQYNNDGEAVSYKLELEPDSRAMVREIGYFAAAAIGKYMYENRMPCIFIGQNTIDDDAINYLCRVLGIDCSECTAEMRTAAIINAANGTPLYNFVCESLQQRLPCAEFSDKPIYNSLCASDMVVSFVRPATRYTDLLTQRALKTSIAASGNPNNINLNRYRHMVKDASMEANKAESFVYETRRKFINLSTQNYIENSKKDTFEGFPLYRDESGAVPVLLCCGAKALIPTEHASDFSFTAGKRTCFEIIALGTENEPAIVKPISIN